MNPIETHEKYLAWIDKKILFIGHLVSPINNLLIKEYVNSLRANRKVLERHVPLERYRGQPWVCRTCRDGDGCLEFDFPCPTYIDVRDGLGIPQ